MISRFEVQSIDLEICATITYEKKKKKIQNYEMLKSKHRKKNQTYRFFYGINSRMTSSHWMIKKSFIIYYGSSVCSQSNHIFRKFFFTDIIV